MHADARRAVHRAHRVAAHVGDHDLRLRAPVGAAGGQAIHDFGPVRRARRTEPLVARGETAPRGLSVLVGRFGLEQVGPRRQHRARQLLQRRDLHDPEAAAVRGGDELVLARMDLEVVHGDRREPGHEPLPRRPAVA